MENAEVEVALEELENRLERLRALYEQYFMGIERIEPAIPRKDIDRRIYILRREKIRNTARRFKLQTLISRYNTFQQYWQRICREIEQGTYKRHVIKAERIAPGKMLTIAARKRLGKAAQEMMEPAEGPAPAPASVKPAPIAALAAPLTAAPAVPAASVAANAVAAPTATTSRLAPPPKPVPPPKPGARPAAAAPAAPAAPAPPVRAAFESLDLDMDFLGDWDPSAAPAKPGAGRRAPEVPARPFGKPLSRPLNTPPAPAIATGELKAPPLQVGKPGAPAAPRAPLAPLPPPRPSPGSPAGPPKPAAPSSAVAAPKIAPAAPTPSAATPTASAGAAAPVLPPPKPAAVAARPPARPGIPVAGLVPPRVAPPPIAARPLAPLVPGPSPKPAGSADVADDRVRELHARLVEAKRQTQDGAAVSMEGLAKSMKATEAKLREQHKNRKIDFDVVIKDGKAVLKPIVR